MDTKTHPDSNGKRVWLQDDEPKQLFAAYQDQGALSDDLEKEVALKFMGLCGLRTQEMLSITPNDIYKMNGDDETHYKIYLEDGKGSDDESTDRNIYVPQRFADLLRSYERAYGIEGDEPFVDRNRRTIQRWVSRASEWAASETGDSRWTHVSNHDLRRSWAMNLLGADTPPTMVMAMGGWSNFKTFREHYLGNHSDKEIISGVSKAF